MLKIDKTMENGKAAYRLEGRLDTMTAPELEQALQALPEDTDALEMDLEKLEYISSAGLRVLLSAHKRMAKQGGLKLLHVNEVIMEIFEVTGFSDILTIE